MSLNGTVTRLDLAVTGSTVTVTGATVIATGYAHRTDPNALVVGPTGLAYDAEDDVLFVASTADNVIFAVLQAGTRTGSMGPGTVVFEDAANLHGPLALAFASPNRKSLLTTNGDAVNSDPSQPSEIVEFTPTGTFVRQFSIDPNSGGAFGVAVTTSGVFAYVDDNTNTITVTNTAALLTQN